MNTLSMPIQQISPPIVYLLHWQFRAMARILESRNLEMPLGNRCINTLPRSGPAAGFKI
jgi:hypothetical protein